MKGLIDVWKATAFGAACVLTFPSFAVAQAAKAGVVTTLQGTATVARATAPQPAPLKFKDDVFIQDHIVTGESAIVRILLGGKAVVTVRERSALTIHETPTTSTIELGSGKIALAVAKDRMKPGESVQIKTPNAMAGVRGTVVIADVALPASDGTPLTTRFTLLTGIVDVSRVDAGTGQTAGQPVLLHPLQTVAVVGHPGAGGGAADLPRRGGVDRGGLQGHAAGTAGTGQCAGDGASDRARGEARGGRDRSPARRRRVARSHFAGHTDRRRGVERER